MIRTLEEVKQAARLRKGLKLAVAGADDEEILTVVRAVWELGLADFILVGNPEKMKTLPAWERGAPLPFEVVRAEREQEAAALAVECVRTGRAGALMKGMMQTSTFLKALLNKEHGIPGNDFLSQISVYNKEDDSGLRLITDCAMAIEPSLEEKIKLIGNAVHLAHALDYPNPRVAVLSALEVVNPKMKDSVEAAILSKMNERGQIKGCIVDGPFAFDNAVSMEAASHKGLTGPVAGQADIILVPNLQVGNGIHKAITFVAQKPSAAAVMGAGVPIVMTSRTDLPENKVLSAALAVLLAPQ